MSENILKVENATMQFGGVVAVDNLNLEINQGEIVALIGPNGAGKTTAFNVVTGVYQPTNGAVWFRGEKIIENHPQGKMKTLYKGEHAGEYSQVLAPTPDKITKLGMARTFQNIRLWKDQTVFDNVLTAMHCRATCNLLTATFHLNRQEEARQRQRVEELLAEKAPHGKICLGFTPDEEIGRGASNFDVQGFGADFAYTLDGGDITDFEYETFNAAMAHITVNGFSIHPGTAKDKMKNALLMAMEFNALLPALETPGRTDGYEGFFHLQEMSGKVEQATMVYIIRDHSMERFQERKAAMAKAADEMNRRYGENSVVCDMEDQYYNMYEVLKDRMEIVHLAEEAMKAAGIPNPTHSPIRGGTDGCMLTYKGLLCPNLPSAGHNAHGRFEYAPVESLKTGVRTVKSLLSPELVERVIMKKEG